MARWPRHASLCARACAPSVRDAPGTDAAPSPPRSRSETPSALRKQIDRRRCAASRRSPAAFRSACRRPRSRAQMPRRHSRDRRRECRDRKSTRLNSSHGYISYAVFCLKKKKKNNITFYLKKKKKKKNKEKKKNEKQ